MADAQSNRKRSRPDEEEDAEAPAQAQARAVGQLEAEAEAEENDPDSDDEKNDGADVDLTGTRLELSEPLYKKEFLQQVIEKSAQFTEFVADGDWECWLADLHTVIPHLVNVRHMTLEIGQSGCGGVDEVVAHVVKLPALEELHLGCSYEGESMQPLMELLSSKNNLRVLTLEGLDDQNEDDRPGLLAAIAAGLRNGASSLRHVEFEGINLNEYLGELGITGESAAALEGKSDDEVLEFLRAE